MRKIFLLLLAAVVTINNTFAQTMYAAVGQGLNVYEKPELAAKVLGKIPYGQKIAAKKLSLVEYDLYMYDSTMQIITEEGLYGNWVPVKFKNRIGYIINSYLLPSPPPKKGVKTLKEYANQLSTIAGQIKLKQPLDYHDIYSISAKTEYHLFKTFYKNGIELHEWSKNDVNYKIYILPDFSVQQAFELLRLLPQYQFTELVNPEEPLPIESTEISPLILDGGGTEVKRDEEHKHVKEIKISHFLEGIKISSLSDVSNQVIITWCEDVAEYD